MQIIDNKRRGCPLLPPYNIPDLPQTDELLPYLRQIDATRWYSNFGPLVMEFERRLQAHLAGMDHMPANSPIVLATVTSCYHALAVGLQLFHLPKAAKVLMPAVTFPACPLAVRVAGAEPVLADIDPASWTLTPEIARRIAAKTDIAAVMPVAVYGVPLAAEGWDEFSRDTGIPVIIDAASALDVQAIPEHCLVAFSLHATKPFGIGEGGILAGRNSDQIDEARLIANFGTRERLALQNGSNAKMSEYHGAVALAQLDRWAGVKQRRAAVFDLYQQALEKQKLAARLQPNIEKAIVSSLMFKLPMSGAPGMALALQRRGIASHRTYLPPLYHHPNFSRLTVFNAEGHALTHDATLEAKSRHMPGANDMMQTVFGLPFHGFMQEADIVAAVDALAALLQ